MADQKSHGLAAPIIHAETLHGAVREFDAALRMIRALNPLADIVEEHGKVVQVAPHCKQETLPLGPLSVLSIRQVPLAQGQLFLIDVNELRDPTGQLKITQAAGTFLDVGLEVVDCLALPLMAGLTQFNEVVE